MGNKLTAEQSETLCKTLNMIEGLNQPIWRIEASWSSDNYGVINHRSVYCYTKTINHEFIDKVKSVIAANNLAVCYEITNIDGLVKITIN